MKLNIYIFDVIPVGVHFAMKNIAFQISAKSTESFKAFGNFI